MRLKPVEPIPETNEDFKVRNQQYERDLQNYKDWCYENRVEIHKAHQQQVTAQAQSLAILEQEEQRLELLLEGVRGAKQNNLETSRNAAAEAAKAGEAATEVECNVRRQFADMYSR